MNAPPQTPVTKAEAALGALFDSRRSASFAPLRSAAFDRFRVTGLPHRRVESYRYSDLKARLRELPEAAAPAGAETARAALAAVPALDGVAPLRIALVNGEYRPELSSQALPPGLVVQSILQPGADNLGEIGRLTGNSLDPLTLLNTALFEGGVHVRVAPGAAIEQPVEIVHVIAGERAAVAMPRLFVSIGEGAAVTFLERMSAGGGGGSVTNALIELDIAADARVRWVKLQGEGSPETHLGTLFVTLADRASLKSVSVAVGSGFSRSQTFASVAGTGVDANFATATVATGGRHADSTLVVQHVAPGSSSRELFRSVVGSGGHAVVQGQIIVAPGAQKTDARMMSNGLFLDDDGEIVNKPELEIFADDVQCAHGATSGSLDEEQVFYLRSRGVPRGEAERLLVDAFLLESLEEIGEEALQAALGERIRQALRASPGSSAA